METTVLSEMPLAQRYAQIKQQHPKSRIRDHAGMLGVGEAHLLALRIGNGVTPLQGGELCMEILKGIQSLGRVMALTRNDHAVHERKGVYNNVSFNSHVGLVLDEEIDLRLFMHSWKYAFAVDEEGRKSVQFFDKYGDAIHKIYITGLSNEAAYEALVHKFRDEAFTELAVVEKTTEKNNPLPDTEIDISSFHTSWLGMTDTHQFFGILKKHGLQREQALRLAPKGNVTQVANTAIETILEQCSVQDIPVMVFVANAGCIQIHSGPVKKLVRTGPWYNVLDPEFNLHLRTDAIANSYIVRKPSEDGTIHSVELFDADGNMIIQFFGKRKPGIPEIAAWSNLLNNQPEI